MFSVAKGGENTLQISANACGIPHAHLSQKNSHTQPRRRQAGTAPPLILNRHLRVSMQRGRLIWCIIYRWRS